MKTHNEMTRLTTTTTTTRQKNVRILMADDDPEEHILMTMAAQELTTSINFDFVSNGSRLLSDLYVPTCAHQLPNLIIL